MVFCIIGDMEKHLDEWMSEALLEAKKAQEEGEVPVGAIVLLCGKIIGRGHNHRERNSDISSHAEIEAMKDAARTLGDWRLAGATLVVTLEPCLMCAGAALQAHIGTIIYGAKDPKEGAIVSRYHVYDEPHPNRPLVYGGIKENECQEILNIFFAEKRDK